MKRKNLSYKEVVKYIANRVENAYNLNACFNEEYINHIQNIGSDIPFRFEFRERYLIS